MNILTLNSAPQIVMIICLVLCSACGPAVEKSAGMALDNAGSAIRSVGNDLGDVGDKMFMSEGDGCAGSNSDEQCEKCKNGQDKPATE